MSISDPEFSTLEFTWPKPCMLLCCSAGLRISLSCGKDNVLDMRICIRFLFASWHDFFGTFYRRNRALEVAALVVVPDDGSSRPAVVDEPPLEDGNVDEVSEAGDVVPITFLHYRGSKDEKLRWAQTSL